MPPVIACHSNCYGRFGARTAIEMLRDAGLEYIEIPIRTHGVESWHGDEPLLTDHSRPDDVHQVLRLLERSGMKLSSCSVASGNPLDPAVVRLTKEKLNVAASLGVGRVVGMAGSGQTPDERDAIYRHLREIGDEAARLGMIYCCDTHAGVCGNPSAMAETMREVDHPHVKLNFDTGNILYFNEHANAEISLAKVSHHVRHVRLKDHSGVRLEWRFPALGYGGGVDFTQVLHVMRSCRFPGPYSIKIDGVEGEPELTLEQHHRRVKQSVTQLRNCGYFD